MMGIDPNDLDQIEQHFRDINHTQVADFGLIRFGPKGGIHTRHEKTVCHAVLRYWGKRSVEGDRHFFTRVKPGFWDWTKACIDKTSGFRPFLESFCYLDEEFIKRTGILLFPDFKYGCPMGPLFSFCVLSRQPWDTQENGNSNDFMKKFRYFQDRTASAAEAVFCTLCFSRVNDSNVVLQRIGRNHGVFCFQPEKFVHRWFTQNPNYGLIFFDELFGTFPDQTNFWGQGNSISEITWYSRLQPEFPDKGLFGDYLTKIRDFIAKGGLK